MKKVCKKWNIMLMIFCLLFTMMPMTALAAQPGTDDSASGLCQTTLTLYYKDKNNSEEADLINIKSVKYDSNVNGVLAVGQGYTIIIEDDIFGDKDKANYDAADYIPDWITDNDDIVWELNDKGDGQQTIQVEKGKENVHAFHYKKGEIVTPPSPTSGGITITKVIAGDVPESDATFTFNVTCPGGYSNEVTITGEDSTTINGLAPGTYTIAEVDISDYTEPSNQDVVVEAGTIAAITFTNTYTKPTTPPSPTSGGITISKVITGDVPESDATFTFNVTCPDVYSGEVTITGAGSKTINGLAPGTYTIAEEDIANYTEPAGQDVVVAAGTTAAITFTNTYTKPAVPPSPTCGGIAITKVITGDVPESDATFTFNVTCPDVYSGEVIITGAGSRTINGLVPGTYTIAERDIADYTEPVNQAVVVSAGTTAAITFTNTYTKPVIPPGDDEEKAYVSKKVAEYDNVNLPADSAFKDSLNLNTLGRSVIYKITLSCNQEWIDDDIYTGFSDLYGEEDNITDELLVLDDGEFVKATEFYHDFPHPINLSSESPIVLYYIDKLDKAGTYTNTANILKYRSETEEVIAASSSAVVVVSESTPPPTDTGSDSTGGHHHHSSSTVTPTNIDPVPSNDTVIPVSETEPATELDDVPKTGDESPFLPLIILGLLSAAILSIFGRKGLIGSASK